MKRDYLGIVEAAYATAPGDAQWIQSIAEAACSCFDRGLGVTAYTYHVSNGSRVRVDAFGSAECKVFDSATDLQKMLDVALRGSSQAIRAMFAPGSPGIFSQVAPPLSRFNELSSQMNKFGMTDAVSIRGGDPVLRGCLIAVPSRENIRLSPRTSATMACLGAHLGSAWRLRQGIAQGGQQPSSISEEADAVLSEEGKLLHLNTKELWANRELLMRYFGFRQQAYGLFRQEESERALKIWSALFEGQWSLLDHIDTDGKRFVLARRNRPNTGNPGALTPREGQVCSYVALGHSNKFIGYELGLSPSAVAEHLKRAMRKLHVRDRAQLISLMCVELDAANT